jgi:hypothetical protein
VGEIREGQNRNGLNGRTPQEAVPEAIDIGGYESDRRKSDCGQNPDWRESFGGGDRLRRRLDLGIRRFIGLRFRSCHGCDKAVALARERFDVARAARVVAEGGTDLVDAETDAAVKVDEGLVAPEGVPDLLAG